MADAPRQIARSVVRPWRLIRLIGVSVIALLVVVSGPLAAQTASQSGITVVGYGEASAPAESGMLQLLLTRGDYYGGPPTLPRPGDVPGAEEQALAAPVVEALVAAGIAETAVTVVVSPVLGSSNYGPGGPAVARIDVSLEGADLANVSDLISTASSAAATQTLILGQVGIGYDVEDCAALDRLARQAAIDDARARAEVQADLLGLTLGDVTASSDLPTYPSAISSVYGVPVQLNGCAPSVPPAVIGSGLSVTVPTFDPTAEPEVEVYAQINLTFVIGS